LTPTLVPPEAVNKVWLQVLPYVRNLIEKISGGRMTEMSIYEDVIDGTSQLWVVFDEDDGNKMVAFVVTRMIEYEKIKMLCIDHLAGERLDEWMQPMYELIERWARDVGGADGVEVMGRPGWERAFGEDRVPVQEKIYVD
jgi:hypothetical protein